MRACEVTQVIVGTLLIPIRPGKKDVWSEKVNSSVEGICLHTVVVKFDILFFLPTSATCPVLTSNVRNKGETNYLYSVNSSGRQNYPYFFSCIFTITSMNVNLSNCFKQK